VAEGFSHFDSRPGARSSLLRYADGICLRDLYLFRTEELLDVFACDILLLLNTRNAIQVPFLRDGV
jgi:hypothetical protein